MDELISVIIPVYKVEAYLNQCVESVLRQTYQNLEILLVDDGSPDRCGAICEQLAKKDGRIKVIHQKNSGQAGARNSGLALARGSYIGFVDSDDAIAENMLETLYQCLIENHADISICGRYLEMEDGRRSSMFTLKEPRVYDTKQAVKEYLKDGTIDAAVWDKLYKRQLFEGVRFPLHYVSEDIPVTYQVLSRAKKAVHCGQPLYYYLQRKGSSSHSEFSKKTMGMQYYSKDVYDHVLKEFPDLAVEGAFFYYKRLLVLYYICSRCKGNDAFKKTIYTSFSNSMNTIFKNPYLKKEYKLFAAASKIHLDGVVIQLSSLLKRYDFC